MFFAQGGGFPGFPGGLFGGKGKGKGGIFADGGEDEDEDEDEDEGADGGMGGSFRDMFGFGTSAGGSERSSSAKREVDNTRLYALLGVEPSASSGEIKKAYHRMAMRHHPDKGGDPETFKDIQQAFEVLGDADKRRRYDRLGEEALDDDGASFRGGGPRRNQAQRTKDKVRVMWVTLEQLYTSVTRPLAHSRKVVDEVDGRPPSRCDACGGQGVVVQMIRLGPIVQQVPHTCPVCSGAGSSAKLKTEREVLDVFVEKGSPDGHKIVFHGRADEAAGCEAGDLVVVVREQEHPTFIRKGADLYLERQVSLAEALTGFQVVVQHLDGRKWCVRSKPGEVLQPQQGGVTLKAVRGGGMPIHQDPFCFGNLFLVLSIAFPRTVEPALAAELRRLLGAPEGGGGERMDVGADVEEAVLEDIDPVESGRSGRKVVDEAYTEDDVGPGARGVQCNQQ